LLNAANEVALERFSWRAKLPSTGIVEVFHPRAGRKPRPHPFAPITSVGDGLGWDGWARSEARANRCLQWNAESYGPKHPNQTPSPSASSAATLIFAHEAGTSSFAKLFKSRARLLLGFGKRRFGFRPRARPTIASHSLPLGGYVYAWPATPPEENKPANPD